MIRKFIDNGEWVVEIVREKSSIPDFLLYFFLIKRISFVKPIPSLDIRLLCTIFVLFRASYKIYYITGLQRYYKSKKQFIRDT